MGSNRRRKPLPYVMLAVIAMIGVGTLVGMWVAAQAGESEPDPDPREETAWTIYWETYDEPAGDPNIPIEDHPSEPANGGQRILPGKKTHDDAHADKRRLVFAVVKWSEDPTTDAMWFRLWDVDDPSANDEPIDEEGSPDPGTNGPDNRDGSWAMAGADASKMVLVPLGQIKRFSGTDSCGPRMCKVAVRVGMQPGDNWRFCACTKEDESDLRGMTQDQADKVQPPGDVKESGMLTAWRKLHVEVDSMEQEPVDSPGKEPDIDTVLVDTVTPNHPTAGQTLVRALLAAEEDFYAHGDFWKHGGPEFPVVSNTDTIGYDDVVIGAVIPPAEVARMEDQVCTIADDDPRATRQLPTLPPPGPIMKRDFGLAYIEPVKIPNEENPNKYVAFDLNIDAINEVWPTWDNTRDYTSSSQYWAAHVVMGYQGKSANDLDPETENPCLGIYVSGLGDGPSACVYVEVSRDDGVRYPPGGSWASIDEIMTHEVGHLGGLDDQPPDHFNIMTELGIQNEGYFVPADKAKLRDLTVYEP